MRIPLGFMGDGIEGNRILVDCDAGVAQGLSASLPNMPWRRRQRAEVRVGAAGNDAVTFRGDGGGKNIGVATIWRA